ncbi:hypothetical protein [Mariluticola halotolerans]|uniref:hypothetical protein n=1 Tax=Mariluticola halotolerans TaxID=2909283 RepID=UPI0026E2007E|nr:hypothetical protein [Mariluticola halotolerans]UJQ93788.1 hypothetical protein L1P08_12470 [Mariluticola halotolerans]
MQLAASIVSAQQNQTRQTLQMEFVRQQQQMDTMLVDMIAEVTQAAPQPGQGTKLDTTV